MFPVGIRVELQDLKAIAHMNGRRGTVCETPEENIGRPELSGRISVSAFNPRVLPRVLVLDDLIVFRFSPPTVSL